MHSKDTNKDKPTLTKASSVPLVNSLLPALLLRVYLASILIDFEASYAQSQRSRIHVERECARVHAGLVPSHTTFVTADTRRKPCFPAATPGAFIHILYVCFPGRLKPTRHSRNLSAWSACHSRMLCRSRRYPFCIRPTADRRP